MPSKGVFITGTDTGVGKTYIGGLLIRELRSRGIGVAPRKPVESGCETRHGLPWPADAARLQEACDGEPALEDICHLRLRAPVSPERAAQREGALLDRNLLVEACRAPRDAFVLVEGAGGLYSPLARDTHNADLCVQLGLPLVVVAADRLGCLNHTLLTCEAAVHHGLQLVAIVLNRLAPDEDTGMSNRRDLESRLALPVLSLSHRADSMAGAILELADLVVGERKR